MDMRIGHGYDVHRFADNRKCIIGGVEIESDRGLLGHSDADVLAHAISDSLLGALALGDIGKHFPDTDPLYKGIDSLYLLNKVCRLIEEKGYRISNVDATVIAQTPRLASYIDAMRARLADAMSIDMERVSVKATTEEHLGFTGRKEGIAAHAVCLLFK